MALILTTTQGIKYEFKLAFLSPQSHHLFLTGKLQDGTEVDLDLTMTESEREHLVYLLQQP